MRTIKSAQRRTPVRDVPSHCFVIAGASLIMTILSISCGGISPCNAASQSDGAALYQKHCSTCHPQALKTRSTEDLLGMVRTPPPGMPAYGEDKLSDLEVRAIGEYLSFAAPGEPLDATVLEPITQEQVRASSGRERTPKAGKSAREKRAWISSFGAPED